MNSYDNSSRENKRKTLRETIVQERGAGNAALSLVDSRPVSVMQRKRMDALTNRQIPAVQMKRKLDINDEEGLEKEADRMGNRAMQKTSKEPVTTRMVTPTNTPIQRLLYVGEGASVPVTAGDLIVEDDDTVTEKTTALQRFWKELAEAGKIDDEKTYTSFFKNEILRQRAFPLRINRWSELTAARIVNYYKEEHLQRPGGELSKNFKPGDKLYGIHDVTGSADKTARPNVGRAPQMRELEKIIQQAGEKKHVIIDTINNVLGISAGVAAKQPVTDEEAANYLAFISTHNRYAPLLADKNADIKKSCKAALEYITTVKGNQVHFELSGIDLAQIASQTDRSVTGSELRSIFRRIVRGGWKAGSPGINPDKVRFYKFGKEVSPPWVSDPKLWEAYARKVMKKNIPVEKKKAGVVAGSGDDHPGIFTSGQKYNDSLKDLLSAVGQIAEDKGAEHSAAELKRIVAAGIPFRSKSAMMNALMGALEEGEQRVATAIVEYILENSE